MSASTTKTTTKTTNNTNSINATNVKYVFGPTSMSRLNTCHPLLVKLMLAVINDPTLPFDITIQCGHRNKADQHRAFVEGNSKLDWPNGNHNALPSLAVDVTYFPMDWSKPDTNKFLALGQFIQKKADALGIYIIWGGNWRKNATDKIGWDSPHYELDVRKYALKGIKIDKVIPKE